MISMTRGLPTAAPAVHAFTVAFAPHESRVRYMRRITRACLRYWDLAPLAPDATLMVSELVTNAIRHGDGRAVRLRVEHHTTELRIAVTDGTSTLPTLHDARDDDEHGRGLYLVAAIADAWGVSSDAGTTWCSLALSATDDRSAA
ncbi:ATP-binding protein [Streptomyces sp. NPDC057638]|uniref:ATP-binding protein n=1 Tax=Streptomyces sp. NPDC057638 TaxID=3346190 RepID=UPI0036C037BC